MPHADVRNEMLRLIGETLREHRSPATSYATSRNIEAKEARLAEAIYENVIEDLARQRDMLATAIEEAVVGAGIIRPDHGGLTGPQLLQSLDELKESFVRLSTEVPTQGHVEPVDAPRGPGV